MDSRSDEIAMKAGLELFYRYRRSPEILSGGGSSDEKNAVEMLREYMGDENFAAHFGRLLEANKSWPVDISRCIPSDGKEALYLEQAAVQGLEEIGIFVGPLIKRKWAERHAKKLDLLDPCAAAEFAKSMLYST